MLILSSFKDYYDFVVRETDNRKVYNRKFQIHTWELFKADLIHQALNTPSWMYIGYDSYDFRQEIELEGVKFFMNSVWFCDVNYRFIKNLTTNEFHYTLDSIDSKYLQPIELSLRYRGKKKEVISPLIYWLDRMDEKHRKASRWLNNVEEVTNLNTKTGIPVIYRRLRDNLHPEDILNGSLIDIQFNKVMKPEEAYTAIYNWIPYNEPVMPSNPDDMQRFQGQGFDKKTSFRK